MTDLLAIDPSVRSPGAAVFRDGTLFAAGKVKVKGSPGDFASEGARWQYVIECIVSWATEHGCHTPEKIVYERPQIYAAAKSKGDPNDLVPLGAIGAGVVAFFQSAIWERFPGGLNRIEVITPTPAEWAGQIPKATKGNAMNSPRAQRILSRLTELEISRMPNQHDAIDAVGLALHALKRLGIRRNYQSA